MINLKDLDYSDTKELFRFATETVTLAEEYKTSRVRYGSAKRYLNQQLAKAYDAGSVETKMSYEKSLLLLSEQTGELKLAYKALTEEEENYKGMERVIEARQSVVSLAQSLCKFNTKQV